MKLKIFTFFILFVSLISFPIMGLETIYLGDFTPKVDIYFDFIIEFDQFDNLDENIIIEFKNNHFKSEKNVVQLSRLNLNLKNERINLNNVKYQVSKDKLLKDVIGYFIPISFELKPIDKPGIYKNIIMVKNIDEEIILEKELVFEINKWARYELSTNDYIQIIKEDLKNNKVKSSGGLILRIAANTNWELSALIDEEGNELVEKLIICLSEKNTEENIQQKHIRLNYKPKIISDGDATVNENNYWTELDVFLEIEDIKNIKAGLKKFPIIFHLETK